MFPKAGYSCGRVSREKQGLAGSGFGVKGLSTEGERRGSRQSRSLGPSTSSEDAGPLDSDHVARTRGTSGGKTGRLRRKLDAHRSLQRVDAGEGSEPLSRHDLMYPT